MLHTPVKPKAKPYPVIRRDDCLFVIRESRVVKVFRDPRQAVHTTLSLADGTRTPDEIAAGVARRTGVDPDVILTVLERLDHELLLEDECAPVPLRPADQDRYVNSLAFFGAFADLRSDRFGFHDRLQDSHVLQLGAGGLGSNVLLNLAGLGVGRITVVDFDRVERRNLGRQFLYTEADVGSAKVPRAVARARAQNSEISIVGVSRRIASSDDVTSLLDGIDLVISAIDQPPEARHWVNRACVRAGVPFVAGGMQVTRGLYYSVDPGRTGCVECWVGAAQEILPDLPQQPRERENSTIGPAAALIGGSIAMEAVRFLSGFVAPVAAARPWEIDLASGRVEPLDPWARNPDCPVCARCPSPAHRSGADVAT